MKKLIFFISLLLILSSSLIACEEESGNPDNTENDKPETEIESMKLKVTVGSAILMATFSDNPTTRDFISLLPLTVKLDDYSNTEKIFYPERKLSTQNAPADINAVTGDITYYSPWGNIAIFYKDFGNSRGLIRIAHFDGNIDVLKTSNSIESVKFELQEEE